MTPRQLATILLISTVALGIVPPEPVHAGDGGVKKRFAKIGQGFKKLRPGARKAAAEDHEHAHEEKDEGKLRSLLARIRGKRRAGGAKNYDGKWVWPVSADDNIVVSSEFGPRWGREHRGMDMAGAVGKPIYAAAPGTVVYAGNGLRGYGNVVILQHDDSTTSLYAHNDRLLVREGETVRQGERIAKLGNTGRSTGPHLHFEIRRNDVAKNPRQFLPKSGPMTTAALRGGARSEGEARATR